MISFPYSLLEAQGTFSLIFNMCTWCEAPASKSHNVVGVPFMIFLNLSFTALSLQEFLITDQISLLHPRFQFVSPPESLLVFAIPPCKYLPISLSNLEISGLPCVLLFHDFKKRCHFSVFSFYYTCY